MIKLRVALVLGLAGAMVMPAAASVSTVTNLNSPLPAGTGWGTLPGENTGTIAITGAAARSGNGSIEITGDRTRAQTGVQFAPLRTNIGSLSSAQSLTFDWQVASDSSRVDYSPALRLLAQDGNQRSELIWEAANQPALGGGSQAQSLVAGTWYTTSSNDLFYRFVAGSGATYVTGETYVLKTLADWAVSDYFTNAATVSGLSVGAGSSASANYHAFADNVTYTTSQGSTTYNFETPVGAVPEPATWAMMIVGFGMVGGAARRRKRLDRAVFA